MGLEGIIAASDAALHAPALAIAGELAERADEVIELAASAGPAAPLRPAAGTADARTAAHVVAGALPREFFDRPAAELTLADWEALRSALAGDPHGAVLRGPRVAFQSPDLRLVVDSLLLGHRDSLVHAERYFGAWRLAAAGDDAIRARAHELLSRPPAELTPDEWRRLGTVVDADPTGTITNVPAQAEREFSTLRQSIVDRAVGHRTDVDEQVEAQFRRWHHDNDPEGWATRLEAASDAIAGGRWTAEQFWTMRVEYDRFEEFAKTFASYSPTQRRNIAWVAANRDTYTLARWMQRHDPEYETLLREAVDAIPTGVDANRLQSALISTAKDRVDELVRGRPLEEQRAIVDRMLGGAAANDWQRANDPNWSTTVSRALDDYIAGTGEWRTRALLDYEGDHLLPVLAARPYEDRLAYYTRKFGDNSEKQVAWLRDNAPDWDAQVATAVDEAVAGTMSDRSRAILKALPERIDELTAGRPFEEQDRIARAVLHVSDHYDWNHAHNPEYRAKVRAAVERIVRRQPEGEDDGLMFIGEKDRIDELLAPYPPSEHERIARAVLGEESLHFAEWKRRIDPDHGVRVRAAAEAAIAGTATREQFAELSWLKDDIFPLLDDHPLPDRIRIMRSIRRGDQRDAWRATQEPELAQWLRRAADEASVGELSDDARVVLRGEVARLDELAAGRDYAAQLRLADATFEHPSSFQGWKARMDPDRVARVRASATAIAEGVATPHDRRVLRGEKDVLGIVDGRPYEERLRVAELALDGGSIGMWRRANDPVHQARLREAVDAAEAGDLTVEQARLLNDDRINSFRILAERSPEAQATVAAVLLGRRADDFAGIHADMRELALDSRARLAALPEVPGLEELRRTSMELVDRNIQRMTGFQVNDPNLGYGLHPDYAELGRVQANVELLEAVAKGRTSSASAQELLSW